MGQQCKEKKREEKGNGRLRGRGQLGGGGRGQLVWRAWSYCAARAGGQDQSYA